MFRSWKGVFSVVLTMLGLYVFVMTLMLFTLALAEQQYHRTAGLFGLLLLATVGMAVGISLYHKEIR